MIGPQQLTRANQRRLDARFSFADMSFDVFYHDDCVIHNETYRKDDRENRQQI